MNCSWFTIRTPLKGGHLSKTNINYWLVLAEFHLFVYNGQQELVSKVSGLEGLNSLKTKNIYLIINRNFVIDNKHSRRKSNRELDFGDQRVRDMRKRRRERLTMSRILGPHYDLTRQYNDFYFVNNTFKPP